MLITRGQTIDGLAAVELRDVLRELMASVFTAAGFALARGLTVDEASLMLAVLERHGLIASGADLHGATVLHGGGEDVDVAVLWQNTVAGNALAKARIGTPMRRARAEALLEGVIARARAVNSDPDEMFWVEVIELFGSLAQTDATMVGDIDLRVLFTHRYRGDDLVAELERRWPGTPLEAVVAATKQLHRCLTGGSRKIDLQLDETISGPLPASAEPMTVYTRH